MEKYDFQILSVAFDHGIWINLDKYGTFAESFAAIWSSFSSSTTRAEAADSCSTNCLNSSSSKLASLSTDSTDPYCYFHRIQTNLLIVHLNYSDTYIGHWTIKVVFCHCWLPCQEAGSRMLGFSLPSRHPAAPGTFITIKYLLQTLPSVNCESNI